MPHPTRAEIHCFRYRLKVPMKTVFGQVDTRPALLVRIEDNDGAEGWGEIWCNFPQVGAEHRAKLAASVAPLALQGIDTSAPGEAFSMIRRRLHGIALQAGEPGPVDQIAAGFDIALCDLAARRASLPLAIYLGGSPRELPAYASGIDCRLAGDMVARARQAGYRAFKLRVGFGKRAALDGIAAARAQMRAGERLMVDANQSWDLAEAIDMVRSLAGQGLDWLEEPLAVDRPVSEWSDVAMATRLPLAGGENMCSIAEFETAVAGSVFSVIQPDIAKWGGLSGVAPLARRILAGGKRYCPHYLGGGVGLAASAHLLAAVGGGGLLEVDCNDNALRDQLAGPLLPLRDGKVVVPGGPGLGYRPDIERVADMRSLHFDIVLEAA